MRVSITAHCTPPQRPSGAVGGVPWSAGALERPRAGGTGGRPCGASPAVRNRSRWAGAGSPSPISMSLATSEKAGPRAARQSQWVPTRPGPAWSAKATLSKSKPHIGPSFTCPEKAVQPLNCLTPISQESIKKILRTFKTITTKYLLVYDIYIQNINTRTHTYTVGTRECTKKIIPAGTCIGEW